jgi:hypothetical protein
MNIVWSHDQEETTVIQETYIAESPATLASVCAGLLASGWTHDQIAGDQIMKSSATASPVMLRFGNVRGLAEVAAKGACSFTLSAPSEAAMTAALRIMQERPAPGANRPIASLLKSKTVADREARDQVRQDRQRRMMAATAPAREAQTRAAAQQSAAWRCTGVAAMAVEQRLLAVGAKLISGPNGMPALQLGAETTIQITTDATSTLSTIELAGYSRSDFSTAVRLITAAGDVHVYNPAKVAAKPMKKSKQTKKQPGADLLAMSDQEFATAIGKLKPRRRAALKKSLERR